MPQCEHCQGTGTIPPTSAFSLPMRCYRCAGSGSIEWEDLHHGDHVCYFYEDPSDLHLHISKFFAEGLKRNERCVYVFDDPDSTGLDVALATQGVDVAAERSRGALVYLTKEETYLAGGVFRPEKVIDGWRSLLEDTLNAGFMGIRGVGESGWVLHDPDHCREVINYELMVDLFFLNEQPRITGVCAYRHKDFPEAVIDGARLSHRLVFKD